MRNRVVSIIYKEILHILRDPRSLFIIFMMPLIMVVFYGYAITFDIKDIKMAIIDHDKTPASRELVQKFKSSGKFRITADLESRQQLEELMMARRATVALVIPQGYGRDVQSKLNTMVQMVIDGSNANTAIIASNYVSSLVQDFSLNRNIHIIRPFLTTEPRVWYNPDLKSAHFVVPGLVAVLLMMICAMLTSITIAREKETGTLEQILVSPVRSYEMVIGKVTPYILLSFLVSAIVVVAAQIIFNVPFRGSILLLTLFSVVYIYASLSLGIFISARARTQQVALMFAALGTLLPSILLSGFIFPISSMPAVLRIISYIVPAKYFLAIIRGIMLKGIGANYLYLNAIFLFVFGSLLLVISVERFSTKLED